MTGDLTLIFGPQSAGALHLNTFIRHAGKGLAKIGVRALPTRAASPLLRRLMTSERPFRERRADFDRETIPRPAVLSALNIFGPPEAAYAKRAFFPGVGESLGPIRKITGPCQVVLVIEPLHHLFLSSGSERLEARVRAAGWEDLFDLGWTDLARHVSDKMDGCDILVLTPRGMALRSGEVLERLFGDRVSTISDPFWLLRQFVSETGGAVLDRMVASGAPEDAVLEDLYTSFARSPSPEDIEQRLGIEKITVTLMEQRFAEDLDAIAGLPGTEII